MELPPNCFISHSYQDIAARQQLIALLPPHVTPFIFPPISVSPSSMVSNNLIEAILAQDALIVLEEGFSSRSFWVAFEREESDLGVGGVGAVIIGSRGEPVGAYSATMPLTRLDESIEPVSNAVLKAGDAASRALGYRGEYPPKEPRSRHRNANKPYVSR